jgi:arginase
MFQGYEPRAARPLGVIGVPTSVGSHNAGQEQAPAAWREVGLVPKLAAAGRAVHDHGDLPLQQHRATDRVHGVRDLDRVTAVARAVADRVEEINHDGAIPVVLGGDCTITLGVVAGLSGHGGLGLLYLDGDADLNNPAGSDSGVLDTMGMTHLLGGGTQALAGLGRRRPLLEPSQVELFGFDPAELDVPQWTTLTERRLSATPAPAVRIDPAAAAAAAWDRLAQQSSRIVLHFDVDVIDTGAFPLANFPHFNGLSLDEVACCLRVFCQRPELAAVVVTEVNPSHDPQHAMLSELRDVLGDALSLADRDMPTSA